MTKDDVLRLAIEADLVEPRDIHSDVCGLPDSLVAFAALVAKHERESCAKFLESGINLAGLAGDPSMQKYTATLLIGCAEAIRARGQG